MIQPTKNYNGNWKKILINEEAMSASRFKPGNFYKIALYKYADGETRTLSGANTTYIFLIGKYTKKGEGYISCIKLKSIDPKWFFNDIKLAFKTYPITSQKIDEVYENIDDTDNDEFGNLLKKVQMDGKNLFSVLKTKKRLYENYREYVIKNIKSLIYVDVDPEYIKLALNINKDKPKVQEKIREELNSRKAENAKQIADKKGTLEIKR